VRLGPRAELSTLLLVGAAVLLVAIGVGERMGNRVIGQIGRREAPVAVTPIPAVTTSAQTGDAQPLWKRRRVISVATDPAFPDPRVTPEPTIAPTPRPTPRPTPSPAPTPSPSQATPGVGPSEGGSPSAGTDVLNTPDTSTLTGPTPRPTGSPAGRPQPSSGRATPTAKATPHVRDYPTLPPVTYPSSGVF
jgi:hypothetical protein